jgi:hypothetical protein
MQVQFVVQYHCNEVDDFVTLTRYKTRETAEKGLGIYRKVFKNLFRIHIEEINDDKRTKRC